MDGYKRFKDPIYGYIDIPVNYVNEIIDTSEFQRLRRISQTSYSALYSSSVHNRFIHSIGVFYLGSIASQSLYDNLSKLKSTKRLDNWRRVKEVFCLACLLHDVGHAPFSHTGEKFFLTADEKKQQGQAELTTEEKKKQEYAELHNELIEQINDQKFKEDIPSSQFKFAAPHEIMSAIVGLNRFGDLLTNTEEKSFFARCITGYKYSDDYGKHGIYNCFISLLNSKVIDVDRLDYLIRDAYFTGYKSTNIDYQRLLTSVVVCEHKGEEEVISYSLGYKKHALSIIENVVFAHDAERKWIQSHPIILYEMYIIQHILDKLNKKFSVDGKKLFSSKTLSKQGEDFKDLGNISLLCDDDIVHLIKTQLQGDELSEEFFERTKRRHPLWKGEAEYRASFTRKYGDNSQLVEKFNDSLNSIEKYITKNTDAWIINDGMIDTFKKELTDVQKMLSTAQGGVRKRSMNLQISDKKKSLLLMTALQKYSKKKNIDCDFVILNADAFYSGFNKEDFGNIQIEFDGQFALLKDVLPTLSGKTIQSNYFYIYYKKCSELDKSALQNTMIKAMI